MYLENLRLKNFRNIPELELSFESQGTLFIGENGQGKTNLLEAIYALSLSRPFRNREKEVFIRSGAEVAQIQGKVRLSEKETEELTITWSQIPGRNETLFQKNGVQKNLPEFLNSKHFFAVLFSPEDVELPFAPPKKRRQFLSMVLSPLFPEFLTALLQFEKVVRERNKLLIEYGKRKVDRMEFTFWDQELARLSMVIDKYRLEFLDFLSTHLSKKYAQVSGKQEEVEVKFLPSYDRERDFRMVLEENFAQDVRFGSTQKGPHRDDFQILLRGKPITDHASRGEIRSILLALKLSERAFIAEETSLCPVLLLDDVFSELDSKRRNALLEVSAHDQVFISSTDAIRPTKMKTITTFRVAQGMVKKMAKVKTPHRRGK